MYIKYQNVCPFVGIGSPSPFPASECVSPLDPKVERSNTPGEDVGVPNSDDWKESLALCTLRVYHYQNFEFVT